MRILMTGISHRSAPLAMREAFSITRDELPGAVTSLKQRARSGVILSTCNRTEIYTVARDPQRGRKTLHDFMSRQFNVDVDQFSPYLYTLEHDEAVAHLYRVAASLDSLIIGESEILGQVRDAYSVATHAGATSSVLTHLFHNALRVGKRARSETAIGRNALSLSRACVELARRLLGDLTARSALIVGVGEASRLAAQALFDAGVGTITVANRTQAHAEELAQAVNGEAADLEAVPRLLRSVDVLVSSTGAPDFLIRHRDVAEAVAARDGRPLLMVDIAVPRDVEPAVQGLDGVSYYTMDDLEAIAEANRRDREAEAAKVERIVEEEVARFRLWWDSRAVTPTIAAIHERAESLRAKELRTLEGLTNLSTAEREKIEAMTRALVKKLLHGPTEVLREHNDESLTQVTRELFGLDETP